MRCVCTKILNFSRKLKITDYANCYRCKNNYISSTYRGVEDNKIHKINERSTKLLNRMKCLLIFEFGYLFTAVKFQINNFYPVPCRLGTGAFIISIPDTFFLSAQCGLKTKWQKSSFYAAGLESSCRGRKKTPAFTFMTIFHFCLWKPKFFSYCSIVNKANHVKRLIEIIFTFIPAKF